MKRVNSIPPPGIIKLEKDDVIGFQCILDSWNFEAGFVKSLLDRASYLIEGVWDSFSDILEEWGIVEIEESLDTIKFIEQKIEAIKHVRVSSLIDIEDLAALDSGAIHFSLLAPVQLATWVFEYNRIVKKAIKEITSLVIQIRLHSCMTRELEAKEIININNKWMSWEESVRKTSIVWRGCGYKYCFLSKTLSINVLGDIVYRREEKMEKTFLFMKFVFYAWRNGKKLDFDLNTQ